MGWGGVANKCIVACLVAVRFAFIKDRHRRMMRAMVSFMDEEIGEMVKLLKDLALPLNSSKHTPLLGQTKYGTSESMFWACLFLRVRLFWC